MECRIRTLFMFLTLQHWGGGGGCTARKQAGGRAWDWWHSLFLFLFFGRHFAGRIDTNIYMDYLFLERRNFTWTLNFNEYLDVL